MNFTINDDCYHLRFIHTRDVISNKFKAVTRCEIIDEQNKSIATGRAWCSANDNFCKETGRKIALKRALKTLPLTKDERAEVWTAYHNRRSEIEYLKSIKHLV